MGVARTYNIDAMDTPNGDVKWYLLEGTDKKVKWFTIIFFLISLAMLIAGSVMLGLGISYKNQPAPVSTPATGYSLFLTAQSKNVNYSSVVNDYTGSVKTLTDQMRQALSSSSSSSFIQQQNVPITILGISDSGKSAADVLYALSYTSSNTPSIQDLTNQISKSNNFEVLSATDQTASSLTNLECVKVSKLETITTTTQKNPGTQPTTVTGAPQTTVTGPSASSIATNIPVKTTTIPFVPTNYSRDILILLDDSTAMLNKFNFNEVKGWIATSLIPQWTVDPQNVQIGFATYADSEFNLILDFDEQDDSQYANVITSQNYTGKFAPNVTFALRASSQLKRTRPVNLTTILISDSEILSDIDSAQQFAKLLNIDPNQLITLSINGTTNGKQLGLLSTNQNQYFATIYSQFSTELSNSISDVIFNHGTPITPPVTVTTQAPDNSCKTDITIVLDSSKDVGSLVNYRSELNVARQLIKTWPISLDSVEGAAILYSSLEGGMIVENPFAYQSASAFANELLTYDDYYFSASPQDLTATLQYVSSNLNIRRTGRQQATVLFTYSSDNINSDTVKYAQQIGGNIIIVGVGKADTNALRQLSGNVLYVKNLTTDVIDVVNNLLCSPTTPLPLITTVSVPATSTTTQSTPKIITPVVPIQTTVSTQPAASTTTTPQTNNCPDCIPKSSNVLFMLEAYGTPFNNQKSLLTTSNLTKTWNHFDRVSLIGFDSTVRFIDPINFGDLQNRDELNDVVSNLNALKDAPTIVSAFNLAITRPQPLASYGKMNTVIFTSGATVNEKNAAMDNSVILRHEGKVIIVGLQIADTTGLADLCDVFIQWSDLSNYNDISTKINYHLNN
ncbi:unnamed protein product [Caenorhabditis angaria]|uniref:VWFA domain-containing protein n=1 Tax=Caenorhabditis angaria TaxID=860376 RepID=A0A9P1N9W2_9PELO|nr:unnamed protein product [Caenorhabditis angaria]